MRIIKYEDEKMMTFHYEIILNKVEIALTKEKLNLNDKMSDILLSLSEIAKELENEYL